MSSASDMSGARLSAAAAVVDSTKGRGTRDMEDDGRYAGESGVFETIGDGDTGPAKCELL